MNGPIDLSLFDLLAGAALIAVNGLLSAWLGLGLGRRLLIVSLRTVVQLMLLGVLLDFVFGLQHALPVLAFGAAMIAMASREALARTTRGWAGGGLASLGSLVLAAGGTAVLASAVIVGVEPWWAPQYLLPLLGMILGNSLTGISLGWTAACWSWTKARRASSSPWPSAPPAGRPLAPWPPTPCARAWSPSSTRWRWWAW